MILNINGALSELDYYGILFKYLSEKYTIIPVSELNKHYPIKRFKKERAGIITLERKCFP